MAAKEAGEPAPQSVTNLELLSLAQNFQPVPASILPAPEPARQQHLSANGHESSASKTAVAIEDEPTVEIVLAPEPSESLLSLGKLSFKPNRSGRPQAVNLFLAPVPARVGSPAMAQSAAPTRPPCGLKPAERAPVGEVDFQAAHCTESIATPPLSEPVPPRRRSVAFMRAGSPAADCSGMARGELAPLRRLVLHSDIERADGAATPLGCALRSPSLIASGVKSAGESLAGLLSALQVSAEEMETAAIRAIHHSFSEQRGVSLLNAPAEIVQAPAPAGTQCLRSEKPKFTPRAPEHGGRAAVIAGAQTPTLAGPCLPPQLLGFDHRNSTLPHRRKRWASWPLSLLVITIIILAVVSAVQYLSQDRDTRAASSTPPAPAQTSKPAPTPRSPVVEEHPAARSVEVAGIRILNGPNKKPQLQFIVINHSAKEITGLNIHVAVRSVDAPADTPLLSVSIPVVALGPNQSKEIHMDVNSSIQASQIPDWQSLRTEILIGRL